MPVEGIWTFTLTTTPDFSSGDGLHGWGLEITRAAVEVPPCSAADVDGDSTVGFSDLLLVMSAWGPCAADCPADIDGDGVVAFSDLLLVLSEWSS
jgi:hypothetical protein